VVAGRLLYRRGVRLRRVLRAIRISYMCMCMIRTPGKESSRLVALKTKYYLLWLFALEVSENKLSCVGWRRRQHARLPLPTD